MAIQSSFYTRLVKHVKGNGGGKHESVETFLEAANFAVPATVRHAPSSSTSTRVRGPVFITRSSRPLSRRQIWGDMKALCSAADVAAAKVFPHNLRHLFAVEYYRKGRNIVKLADMMRHSSIETTRIYLVTPRAEHRRHLDSLGLVIALSIDGAQSGREPHESSSRSARAEGVGRQCAVRGPSPDGAFTESGACEGASSCSTCCAG